MNEALLSTGKDDWETPKEFFEKLNKEFNFTLDPCSSNKNHKCSKYYTEIDDGLSKDWSGEIVFCNPPYSVPENPCKPNCTKKSCLKRGYHITEYKPGQEDWIKKCYEEGKKTTVVMLIPSRTDTKAFHDYILGKSEIRFIKGRLKFVGAKDPAPFPNMLVIYKPKHVTTDKEMLAYTE